MATVSISKSSLNVSAAIAVTGTTDGQTLYTCPASSYAILNMLLTFGFGSLSISVGGQQLASISSGALSLQQVIVGPGQSVTMASGAGPGVNNIYVSGVQFTNT